MFNGSSTSSTSSTFTTTCSKDSKDADVGSKVADAGSKVADAGSKDSGSKVSKCFGCNVSTFTSLAEAPSLTFTTVTHS